MTDSLLVVDFVSPTYPLLNEAQGLDLPGLKDSLTNLAKSQSKVMSWLNDPAHNPTGLSLTANERMEVLRAFANVAMEYEDVGFTLLIDAAYHVYAKEPHGWAETLTDALHDGMEWPANLLLTFAISLSKSTQYTDYEEGLWLVFTQMNR